MILLLDNFDSFTFNLVDYFRQLGRQIEVIRNDISPADYFHRQYEGLVISPGPETPEKSGHLMPALAHFKEKIPVLGICLGHQAIGEYYGARLVRGKRPMHGKISVIDHDGQGVFRQLPRSMNVVRYNSLILEDVIPPLVVSAHSSEGEVMGVRHHTLPVEGVQFHPEAALTEHGLMLLRNWLENNAIGV